MQYSLDGSGPSLVYGLVIFPDDPLAQLPEAVPSPAVHHSVVVDTNAVEQTALQCFELAAIQVFGGVDKRFIIPLAAKPVPVLTKHECVDAWLAPCPLGYQVGKVLLK